MAMLDIRKLNAVMNERTLFMTPPKF